MANRITQIVVETVNQGQNARVTQAGVEALTQGAPAARVSQEVVQSLAQGAVARVTQAGVEALTQGTPSARVSQAVVQVLVASGDAGGGECLTPLPAPALDLDAAALFDEVQFPPKISFGAVGGPVWQTTVLAAPSGREQRVGRVAHPLGAWQVSHAAVNGAQAAALEAFYRARQGQLRAFRFKDWTDYRATDEPLANPADGRPLLLTKTYASGPSSEVRRITKPVPGTVTLTRNGDPLDPSRYTVDYATGVVTLACADAAAYAWSGEFDVPTRFAIDLKKGSRETFGQYAWTNIPIVEVRL